ncbi:hypothetical protein C2845_PM15G02860 [Panicum miliaceum]|uniref:GRF-type domain-containing protein n=1 Tax=Panicum miliaceum TaxID=4540 RepID=A0A3L6Q4P5_PANMI|nr:hypothetical protein C2845_PM15G02860 [Panicum miliaceum]
MGSPVAYRAAPLAYELAVMCRCGLKFPRWISWSDENPGHRYYRCRRSKSEMDCAYLVWIDPEPTPFMKTLLLDLRDVVWRLKKENANLKIRLHDGEEVIQLQEMNQALARDNIDKIEELKAKDMKLEEQNATLQVMAAEISSRSACSSFYSVVAVFAVALGVGMLLGRVMFA